MNRSLVSLAALAAAFSVPAFGQQVSPQPAPSAKAAPLGAEAFAALPAYEDATISPDGQHIAGKFPIGGKQVIAIQSLFDPAEKPALLSVSEESQADWVLWAGNDDLVIHLTALIPLYMGEKAYVSRLVALNRKTGKMTKILWDRMGQDAADVIWIAPDNRPEILVAAQNSIFDELEFYPRVFRVNVATGKQKVAMNPRTGVRNWAADASGTVRTGEYYSDQQRTFRLLYRGEGQGSGFKEIDRANTRKNESLLSPILFVPGTNHAVITRTRDDNGEALVEVDLTTQQDVRTLFDAPAGVEINRVTVSDDGKSVVGLSTSDGQVHWLDPLVKETQDSLDKAVPGQRARIVSMANGRNAMLVALARADTPGILYYYDAQDGRMQRLGYFSDAIKAGRMAPVRTERYIARDNLSIEAVVTSPKDRAEKNLPVIIMPHGGPWAQDRPEWDYMAQYVANLGYLVIQPNFRGSTGYGTEFTRRGEGQMGLAMQDDLVDALNWAVRKGLADPKRACIVGASYGGYAAMWGIARDPDLYRCAISISGVASLRREVNDFGRYSMGGKFADDWKKMTPDFTAVSPANFVQNIKAPLLLIHGKQDVTVDFGQSALMEDRMRAAGKNVEFLRLPEADHYFTRAADRLAMLQAMGKFLVANNPPDP
ncbi:alpha/beta hydrolase family protein [Novosphingobium cyanobacteriorum]|uniref:Prolyl oligopeptidase family serine peptidase n=1 Tax=Novosphingobium cyanobacteriorum TaxID=3024215 RepID=A0ABT6CE80_9SPHN|nr:prolyl oligopeptidase family serine peptidase [Novosphingobium cyanobacteriorum]MDF8332233.1 prolyl oligopeptidase family serine peptidase [Novosphingobium cyanobacteriorum]